MEKATRNTRQKQQIYAILQASNRPLTATEIYLEVRKQQPTISKSTVYRNLDALLHQGMLTQGLHENGERFFLLKQPAYHKHFLICRGCDRMFDLPECPLNLQRIAGQSDGFIITDHMVQLYGYCRQCAATKREKENKGTDETVSISK